LGPGDVGEALEEAQILDLGAMLRMWGVPESGFGEADWQCLDMTLGIVHFRNGVAFIAALGD